MLTKKLSNEICLVTKIFETNTNTENNTIKSANLETAIITLVLISKACLIIILTPLQFVHRIRNSSIPLLRLLHSLKRNLNITRISCHVSQKTTKKRGRGTR